MKCPKCGKEYDRLLALSRVDNKTMICDKCGTMEAVENFHTKTHLKKTWEEPQMTEAKVYISKLNKR